MLAGFLTFLSFLPGCTTFTGIPSHGGGKRFAVEQELIAASARATAKAMDVTPLVGRRCALWIYAIGDEGSGNLIGGRYEWQAAVRGDYVVNPTTVTRNSFPTLGTASQTTTVGDINTLQAFNGLGPLNFPERSRQHTEGDDIRSGVGASYPGVPGYRTETFITNPNDAVFLRSIVLEALLLKGVVIVPPDQAEIDVYVSVDIFGTHRSRLEMHVYNEERLMAKTAFQLTALRRPRARPDGTTVPGSVIVPPCSGSFQADYIEKYVLWCGPFEIEKRVCRSEPLLVDYSDIPIFEPIAPDAAPEPAAIPPAIPPAEALPKPPETIPPLPELQKAIKKSRP